MLLAVCDLGRGVNCLRWRWPARVNYQVVAFSDSSCEGGAGGHMRGERAPPTGRWHGQVGRIVALAPQNKRGALHDAKKVRLSSCCSACSEQALNKARDTLLQSTGTTCMDSSSIPFKKRMYTLLAVCSFACRQAFAHSEACQYGVAPLEITGMVQVHDAGKCRKLFLGCASDAPVVAF